MRRVDSDAYRAICSFVVVCACVVSVAATALRQCRAWVDNTIFRVCLKGVLIGCVEWVC